jgi:hypothetical protein
MEGEGTLDRLPTWKGGALNLILTCIWKEKEPLIRLIVFLPGKEGLLGLA